MRFPLLPSIVKSQPYTHILYSGTYFGTREEYDTLDIEVHLGSGSVINVDIIDDWSGTVLNWAEEEATQVIGGIVSPQLHVQSCIYSDLISSILIASRFLREES